jgi:hypothetical protein
MSIKLVKSVNFGKSQGSLGTVGFTLIDGDGIVSTPRSTTGVNEVGTNTGIYAAQINFTTEFSGSVLWDTGAVVPKYAAEEYNPTEERLKFNFDVAGGRWVLDSVLNQMVFYTDNNVTEVARFDMKDSAGAPSVTQVFSRTRA